MIRSAKTIKRIVGGVLLVSAAWSGALHAAGLGKLSVTSALGQPLQAEIELVSLQPGEFESLNARVASPDAYREARIEYSSALRQIRFTPERRANGTPILKVTTVGPINEPFLDVLVELTWPAGKLLREYPILLDPPGFTDARPPVAASAPAAATTAAPSSPQVATVAPPKAVDPVKPSVSAAAPATPAKAAPAAPDTYEVKKGDTLNKIASEVKPETVSLEQMLVALYRENQAAFIDSNMNRLKAGQILRVPTQDNVAKISNSDAKKEIRVQVENWKNYRESVAGAVASSTPSSAPANQASGKIATATPGAPTGAPSKDVLKIAKADAPAGAATGAAGSKAAQDQINALKEEATAREGALKEAKSRVADLEKQIADMRKLMELKGITPPGKPGEAAKPVAKADEKKAPEPAKPADTKVAQVTPAKPAEPAKAPEPAKVEPAKTDAAKPADPAKPADAAKPAEPPKSEEAKPADKPKPAPAKPKAAPPPPPPEPTIMDMIMENLALIGGGIGALVLGVGGFLFARKRKAKASNTGGPFTSAASSILPSDLKPPTTTSGKAAGGLIDTGNSSFLTDFDKQGSGTIDTDEVDPVAEAEVYIAYGRDAQAEEILKEAMGRDKSRHEITLKLLEIYHTRKSVQAFETLAREFKDTAGETSPAWARAAAMGAQLDPSNSLYAGFASQDFGSTATMPAAAAGAGAAAAGTPPDLDFDLGFNSEAPKPTVDVPLDTPSTQPDIDLGFDLNLSGPDSVAPAAAPAADAGSGLDFDLDLDKTVAAPSAPAAAAPAAADAGFDFDLSSLSLDSGSDKTTPVASTPENEKTAAFNLGDISLDLDAGPATGADAAPAGSGDASSTKLELARAYVEIGDKDGAKEILQEVMREGTAAQKQEAQALMSSL
ncbi:MAG: FimV/HubP family polar landmark protein [Burkholderiales bacterium]|nr:FimV/HubP family polar landmark protein [Burkholderiales bacterium]